MVADHWKGSNHALRYDVYYLETLLELTADMKELYKAITVHLRKTLPECNVEDFFFETDTAALRHDMARNCADNCEGLLVGVWAGDVIAKGWARWRKKVHAHIDMDRYIYIYL